MTTDRFIPKGEYVFREGESANYAYVLKTGSVDILKIGVKEDFILTTIDTPNALFGEMALIDGAPRSAGARASADVTVTEIDQNDFLAYVQKNPTAAMNIMKQLSTELRSANKSASLAGNSNVSELSDIGEMQTDVVQHPEDIDDTDAIYDTPASRPLIYTGGALLLFFIIAIFFSFQAVIETTVSARGKFTTEVPNVEVQSTSSAVVRKLLVKRGQSIKKGQLVVLLDGTVAEADLKGILERLRSVEGRRHRLKLEQSLIKSRQQISGDRGLSPLNLDILTKRLGQYRSKISSFAFKIKKLKQEISSAKTEVSSAKETVKLIKKQLEIKEKIEAARKKLYGSSHGSLLNYLQARDATLSARQSYFNSLNAVDSKVASMIGKLSDRGTLKADEDAFISKWSSGLGENLSKEQETYIQLKQEILKLKQNMDNIEVRAPVDGIILDIPTVSEGSIVKEGERLLTMVLSNQPLTLEIDVDPKDISDVSLNIPTSVKLDALPFQQYGDLDGKLIYISEDTYTESLSGEKGAFYRGRIHITPTELSKLPPGFQLTSGMLASADMKVGEKHVITYLTYPIIKGFSSAFTEPD